MTKNEVIGFLEGGMPPEKVGDLAQQFGISFIITRQTEAQLRDAGATDELIKTLRRVAPKPTPSPSPAPQPTPSPNPAPPPSPPVLLIEATPGGAQAYVDDEPVGTTSSEGRLRLSRLSPGQHAVRLSLSGHRDFEQTIELAAGQTARLAATLEAVKPVAPPAPTPTPTPTPTQPTVEPAPSLSSAYFGVALAPTQPPGAKGVVISGTSPGSPADRIGLHPYDVIVRVDGRQVKTPQELQQSIGSHNAGDTVEITYFNGHQMFTRRAQLMSRPAEGTSVTPAQPSYTPPAPQPNYSVAQFYVAHDHGPPAPNYCVGVMAIGNGYIQYQSTNGVHSFQVPLGDVKEAKKNAVYLANIGAFHVRLKKGTVYNFVVVNAAGQYQPPDTLLQTIDRALGR